MEKGYDKIMVSKVETVVGNCPSTPPLSEHFPLSDK